MLNLYIIIARSKAFCKAGLDCAWNRISRHISSIAASPTLASQPIAVRSVVPNSHDELVEEVASFPSGEHDDLVDSMTQALLRFRKGGFLSLPSDHQDYELMPRRKASYY